MFTFWKLKVWFVTFETIGFNLVLFKTLWFKFLLLNLQGLICYIPNYRV